MLRFRFGLLDWPVVVASSVPGLGSVESSRAIPNCPTVQKNRPAAARRRCGNARQSRAMSGGDPSKGLQGSRRGKEAQPLLGDQCHASFLAARLRCGIRQSHSSTGNRESTAKASVTPASGRWPAAPPSGVENSSTRRRGSSACSLRHRRSFQGEGGPLGQVN